MPVDRTPPDRPVPPPRVPGAADTPLPGGADTSDEETPRPDVRPSNHESSSNKYQILAKLSDEDLHDLVQRILAILDERRSGTRTDRPCARNLAGEFDVREGGSQEGDSPMSTGDSDSGSPTNLGSGLTTGGKRKQPQSDVVSVEAHVKPKRPRDDTTTTDKTSDTSGGLRPAAGGAIPPVIPDPKPNKGGTGRKLTGTQPIIKNVKDSQNAASIQAHVDRDAGERVPPIVIHDKSKWTTVSSQFKTGGHNFTRATNTQHGMRFHPQTETDFRGIRRILDAGGHEYHTYQLQSEKLLNVVLRGIPCEIDEQEVEQDLRERGFDPVGVYRMRKGNRRPMPLVLVKVPKTEKNIFDLTEVLHTFIQVESLRASAGIGQCHRCQRFGHAQSRCTGARRCPRCALDHVPGKCELKNDEPFRCANCQGAHKSTSRACPRYPKKSRIEPSRVEPSQPPTGRTVRSVSYADAVASAGYGASGRGGPDSGARTPRGTVRDTPRGGTDGRGDAVSRGARKPGTPRVEPAAPLQPVMDLPAMLAAFQNLSRQMAAVADQMNFLMPRSSQT